LGTGSPITIQWDNDNAIGITNIQGVVPEPATWAMMLVGFFGLGTALRRRAGPGAGKRSRARSLRLVDHDQQEARPQGLLLNLRHG
jgi:hypothetical protein